MSLNKQSGNMYPWITHTWNPVRGKCPHDCIYCYMKGKPIGDLRFVEKEMQTNLGTGKKIFVGSSTDMFADDVPMEWIAEVLRKCRNSPDNWYFFQTKNPIRLLHFPFAFPQDDVMIGVTIESNRDYEYSKAPKIEDRIYGLEELSKYFFPIMVSIEPILDFDLVPFIGILNAIKPVFISIGADSKNHHLQEPSSDKLRAFIKYLNFLEVKVKNNLKRLLDGREWEELPEGMQC
jgi:DNA repair photolyase